MPTHLVWFRADLRLHDNIALAAACRSEHARVLALFIATPGQWQQHDMAPRQAAYLCSHLNALQRSLAEKGIPLIYKEVSDFTAQVSRTTLRIFFTTTSTNSMNSSAIASLSASSGM